MSGEEVLSLICLLRDELANGNADAIETRRIDLTKRVKPDVAMNVLAPFLFRGTPSDHGDDRLSRQDALTVMGYLVSSDPDKYLLPASRAVKLEAVRLKAVANEPMTISPELTTAIVNQLTSGDIEVSENATEVLSAACLKLGPTFASPTMQAVRDAWQQAWDQLALAKTEASTVCVRCASAMVEIALSDDALMQVAISSGATTTWITMLQYQDDPLLQISTLDLVEKLANTRPFHSTRTQWLFSDAVIKTVLYLSGGFEGGVPDPLLGGAALRVVAALCKQTHGPDAALLVKNEHLLNGFHQALHNWEPSGSEVDRLAIVDAVSSFASASEHALDLVLDDPVTRKAWLSLSVAQPKLKAAILVSVARVLDPVPEKDANGDSVETTRPSNGMKLYAAVGPTNDQQDTTTFLLSMTRSPLPEVRIGSYALIEAVAKLPTGGQVLFMNSDFFAFLTNRDNEPTGSGRQAKFAIVEAILSSPVKGLLADDIVRQLEKYRNEGPHYKKAMGWELATD